jgi:hypothetical protein
VSADHTAWHQQPGRPTALKEHAAAARAAYAGHAGLPDDRFSIPSAQPFADA